jgi:hypothetical protein
MAQELPNDVAPKPPRKRRGATGRELKETIARRERELAVLARISIRLHGEEDVDAILEATVDGLLEGLGLQTAWIFLEDEKDGSLRLAAHRGISPEYLELVSVRACAARSSRRARGARR